MNVRDLLALLRAPVCAGRLGLLRAAVALGEAGRSGPARPLLRATWAPGVSVVIPERGTPLLLKRALVHLRAALARIAEPWEVIVVVNGEPARTYADLRAGFPEVRWLFHEQALGFGGALEGGLAAARFGGVYLHNSDMALEENALGRCFHGGQRMSSPSRHRSSSMIHRSAARKPAGATSACALVAPSSSIARRSLADWSEAACMPAAVRRYSTPRC